MGRFRERGVIFALRSLPPHQLHRAFIDQRPIDLIDDRIRVVAAARHANRAVAVDLAEERADRDRAVSSNVACTAQAE